MKLLLIALALLTIGNRLIAQAPQGIPYQAIARNSGGSILASQPIRVRFTVHDSVATGVVVYQETFTPTTNTMGLFNVNVGTGSVVTGVFSSINWGHNAKYMQVEMDPTGGTTYTDMGTQQMMSVPYAFYAGSAGSIGSGGVGQPHMQVFTSSGTFTTSANITTSNVFKITVIGGGGSGGSGAALSFGGGGGGAGATAIYLGSGLNPLTGYTVIVGSGGASSSGAGNNGGTSSVILSGLTITSSGGLGGSIFSAGGTRPPGPGNGGTASNGTINISGGAGDYGTRTVGSFGAGGSGGASSLGGSDWGGPNGAYGSGGLGGASFGSSTFSSGAAGISGIVIFEWVE